MKTRQILTGVTLSGVILAQFALGSAATAAPAPQPAPAPTQPAAEVQAVKEKLIDALGDALHDVVAKKVLISSIAKYGQVDPLKVFEDSDTLGGDYFTKQAKVADGKVKSIKGLEAMTSSSLRLRLADPEMADDLKAGVQPLIAAEPEDGKRVLTAYDLNGRSQLLSADNKPDVPVLVLDLDSTNVSAAGSAVVSKKLKELGVEGEVFTPGRDEEGASVAAASAVPSSVKVVTKLEKAWLKEDHEPWFKGKAEIYGMAMGEGVGGGARVDIVQLPWLNHDHTTYTANTTIIDWSHFAWTELDFIVMEEDDGTNYQAVATAIAGVILAAIPGGGPYVPVAAAIIELLGSDFWTDNDDFVDSYVGFKKTWTGGPKAGDETNAKFWVKPKVIFTP